MSGVLFENKVLCEFKKYFHEGVFIASGRVARTLCGDFLMSLYCTEPIGRSIAIEQRSDDPDSFSRDEWRDAMVVGDRCVDAVYRVGRLNFERHMEDVLYALSILEPDFFCERKKAGLKELASIEVIASLKESDSDMHFFKYKNDSDSGGFYFERRDNLVKYKRDFGRNAYEFASSVGGGDLDAIIQSFRQENNVSGG